MPIPAMNRDDATLEEALRQCGPSRLDDRVTARMLMALDGASAPVDAVDRGFEATIAGRQPSRLPDALMDRVAALAGPDIVAMPGPKRVIAFRRFAAAAAIAMVGAAAALLAPIGGEAPQVADTPPPPAPRADSTVDARAFVPASHQRGLSDARDEGIVWKDNTAHRILRIVYTDIITLRNEAGEVVEVEQPRVEYILVPKKVD